AKKRSNRVSLAKFLIDHVRAANRPITARELAEEMVRSKYPTKAGNLRGMVETRVGELVRKGVFRRPGDQAGVVLGKASAVKLALGKPANAAVKPGAKKTVPAGAGDAPKQSLQTVLREVLGKSSRPLSTQELAEQVLASGYKTKSQDFKNVIWVSIGNM